MEVKLPFDKKNITQCGKISDYDINNHDMREKVKTFIKNDIEELFTRYNYQIYHFIDNKSICDMLKQQHKINSKATIVLNTEELKYSALSHKIEGLEDEISFSYVFDLISIMKEENIDAVLLPLVTIYDEGNNHIELLIYVKSVNKLLHINTGGYHHVNTIIINYVENACKKAGILYENKSSMICQLGPFCQSYVQFIAYIYIINMDLLTKDTDFLETYLSLTSDDIIGYYVMIFLMKLYNTFKIQFPNERFKDMSEDTEQYKIEALKIIDTMDGCVKNPTKIKCLKYIYMLDSIIQATDVAISAYDIYEQINTYDDIGKNDNDIFNQSIPRKSAYINMYVLVRKIFIIDNIFLFPDDYEKYLKEADSNIFPQDQKNYIIKNYEDLFKEYNTNMVGITPVCHSYYILIVRVLDKIVKCLSFIQDKIPHNIMPIRKDYKNEVKNLLCEIRSVPHTCQNHFYKMVNYIKVSNGILFHFIEIVTR